MLELARLETTEQKNPLLYLDYEGASVRVVLDNRNTPWLVMGDLCQILGIREQHFLLRKTSLRPYLAMAALELPSGPYNLGLINSNGVDRLFTLLDLREHVGFLRWLHETLPDIARKGRTNPPRLNIDAMALLEG